MLSFQRDSLADSDSRPRHLDMLTYDTIRDFILSHDHNHCLKGTKTTDLHRSSSLESRQNLILLKSSTETGIRLDKGQGSPRDV